MLDAIDQGLWGSICVLGIFAGVYGLVVYYRRRNAIRELFDHCYRESFLIASRELLEEPYDVTDGGRSVEAARGNYPSA